MNIISNIHIPSLIAANCIWCISACVFMVLFAFPSVQSKLSVLVGYWVWVKPMVSLCGASSPC